MLRTEADCIGFNRGYSMAMFRSNRKPWLPTMRRSQRLMLSSSSSMYMTLITFAFTLNPDLCYTVAWRTVVEFKLYGQFGQPPDPELPHSIMEGRLILGACRSFLSSLFSSSCLHKCWDQRDQRLKNARRKPQHSLASSDEREETEA